MTNVINMKDHRKPIQPILMSQALQLGEVELNDGTTIPITPGMILYCLYNVERDTIQFIEEFKPLKEDK